MSKYIVGFQKSISPDKKSAFLKDVASNGGEVHSEFDSIGAVSCSLPDQYFQSLNSKVQSLGQDNEHGIRYIEPDGPVSIQPTS